jgi:catechol 2,3-dioxygenase-like lactoylglutathione lyase family enzyme
VTLSEHATVLLVQDVQRALDYYRDQLGFEISHYERIPEHYGFARRDACSVHFACFADAPRRLPNCEIAPPDMFDIYVYADDVDRLHAELVERGADILHGPLHQGYGTYEFRVRDPDGYVIAFGNRGGR